LRACGITEWRFGAHPFYGSGCGPVGRPVSPSFLGPVPEMQVVLVLVSSWRCEADSEPLPIELSSVAGCHGRQTRAAGLLLPAVVITLLI